MRKNCQKIGKIGNNEGNNQKNLPDYVTGQTNAIQNLIYKANHSQEMDRGGQLKPPKTIQIP